MGADSGSKDTYRFSRTKDPFYIIQNFFNICFASASLMKWIQIHPFIRTKKRGVYPITGSQCWFIQVFISSPVNLIYSHLPIKVRFRIPTTLSRVSSNPSTICARFSLTLKAFCCRFTLALSPQMVPDTL